METTTLEQAAESLLSPGPETETEETNLSEAVEEITEPTDDGQGEVLRPSPRARMTLLHPATKTSMM